MKGIVAAVLLGTALAAGAPARAETVIVEQSDVVSFTGGYYGTRTSVDAPLWAGRYRLGAEARTFRFEDAMRGTKEEYSAHMSRELYHVALSAWLGTAPPNTQRASYHLAGGETRLVFYGLSLGPERPELSALVWESSGPVPSPASLDREWVTRARVVYNNVDNHLAQPTRLLTVVENMWQFEVSETWRGDSTVGAQVGGSQYDATLPNGSEVIFQDIIDYPGMPTAVRGWPNNYFAGFAREKYRDWTASLEATRLNLLDNGLVTGYSVGLERSLGERWKLRTAYFHRRRRGVETREGLSFGASYLW
jgi:hypothetical protein